MRVWRYAEESDLIALLHNLSDLVWKKCKKVLFLGMFELFTESGCSNNQYLISFVGLIFYIYINVIDWLIDQSTGDNSKKLPEATFVSSCFLFCPIKTKDNHFRINRQRVVLLELITLLHLLLLFEFSLNIESLIDLLTW